MTDSPPAMRPRHHPIPVESDTLPPHQETPSSPIVPAISPYESSWPRTDYFAVTTTTTFAPPVESSTSLSFSSHESTPLSPVPSIFSTSSFTSFPTSGSSLNSAGINALNAPKGSKNFLPPPSNIKLHLPQERLGGVSPNPVFSQNEPAEPASPVEGIQTGTSFYRLLPGVARHNGHPPQLTPQAPHSHYIQALLPSQNPLPISAPSYPPLQQPPVGSNSLSSTLDRDALLAYAQRLFTFSSHGASTSFNSGISTNPGYIYSQLLPLLNALRNFEPTHLPTLLLLSCVFYALGDLQASLSLNFEILAINPNYAEAMSNIGTTLQSLGRTDEAETWWRRAIQLRPTYWDAIDNLISVLTTPTQELTVHSQSVPPRYHKAFELCEFVQGQVIHAEGYLITPVPAANLHRLQNLLCTRANLRLILKLGNTNNNLQDHCRALELLIRPPGQNQLGTPNTKDLIVGACIAALVQSGAQIQEEIAFALGMPNASTLVDVILHQRIDLLGEVHRSGDRIVNALFQNSPDVLPTVLLLPNQVLDLRKSILTPYSGALPALCAINVENKSLHIPSPTQTAAADKATSTVVLTVAKIFHDLLQVKRLSIPGPGKAIQLSTSTIMLCYYIALSLHPLPSTYNNLGILLSSSAMVSTTLTPQGRRQVLNGPALAHAYYRAGLALDPQHPHLLTNLGSLLKDQGNVQQALELYSKAIEHKPDFDVALANMANAFKDAGRIQDAIIYYRRAFQVNNAFPEAICGLANAMCAVCDWQGRGGIPPEPLVDGDGQLVVGTSAAGWMGQVVAVCSDQLSQGYSWGTGVIRTYTNPEQWMRMVEEALETDNRSQRPLQHERWRLAFLRFFSDSSQRAHPVNEGAFIVRLIETLVRFKQRKWYLDAFGMVVGTEKAFRPILERLPMDAHSKYARPRIPAAMGSPTIPSVLPFHTFTYPLSPSAIRIISYRNAIRISHSALTQPWLPTYVFPPPSPPRQGKINLGYVSSDFNNHPLGHLMQSVFGFHDRDRFNVFLYATTPSDGSQYRRKIETEAQHFFDVSLWSNQTIVHRIVTDEIHILINLGGYTKGARNDIFAARPSPIQIALMGFAGTLAAGWCDYLVCDTIACPEDTSALWHRKRFAKETEETTGFLFGGLDPESPSDDWMFPEKFIYMPHTFFVTDHKQAFQEDEVFSPSLDPVSTWRVEEYRRLMMRREIFPDIPDDTVIFANFSQLYKVDPVIFAAWLRILKSVPGSILWLLRFPAAGEDNLRRTALKWAGEEVASRIHFTDVAKKEAHIRRCRVADLFLDTIECNAHTIATDVLWSGTPILTWPKYRLKMCSRVGASVANATGFGHEMIVGSLAEYEQRAAALAESISYETRRDEGGRVERRGFGRLINLRRALYLNRHNMPLFDTRMWTRHLEKGLEEAWKRWVIGTELEASDEWEVTRSDPDKETGCIWIAP